MWNLGFRVFGGRESGDEVLDILRWGLGLQGLATLEAEGGSGGMGDRFPLAEVAVGLRGTKGPESGGI